MVELLVAFTLFAVVLSVVTSIFVVSYRSQRAISELILVNDNTYLTLEQMARDVRDGQNFNFDLSPDISCNSDCFAFLNRNGEYIVYDYDSTNHAINRIKADFNSPTPFDQPKQVTARNIEVKSFRVTPNDCNSGNPVRITLNLEIGPRNSPNVANFINRIQTTIATRNYAKCASG